MCVCVFVWGGESERLTVKDLKVLRCVRQRARQRKREGEREGGRQREREHRDGEGSEGATLRACG